MHLLEFERHLFLHSRCEGVVDGQMLSPPSIDHEERYLYHIQQSPPNTQLP
jgi:hypothetical protein